MKYQICPICDQKLTRSHYCGNCHKRIRKPWTIDVDYYLNERHPDYAHDCTFHDYAPAPGEQATYSASGDQAAYSSWGDQGEQAAYPASYPASDEQAAYGSHKSFGRNSGPPPARPVTKPNVPRRAQRSGGGATSPSSGQPSISGHRGFVVMAIALIVVFGLIIIGFVYPLLQAEIIPELRGYDDYGRIFSQQNASAAEDEYDLGDTVYEEVTLSDQEVVEAGQPCNAFGHFPGSIDEMTEEIIPFITENFGFTNADTYEHSYNSIDDGYAYYNSSTTFSFEDAEPSDSFAWRELTIEWDTAVRSVHAITITWPDENQAADIFKEVIRVLCAADGWPMEEGDFDLWIDDAMEKLHDSRAEIEAPKVLSENDIYVGASWDEDIGCCIMVYNWGE